MPGRDLGCILSSVTEEAGRDMGNRSRASRLLRAGALALGVFCISVASPLPRAAAAWDKIDTILVYNTEAEAEPSVSLDPAKTYKVVASGSVSDWGGVTTGVDPLYCHKTIQSCSSPPMLWRQLRLDITSTNPSGVGLDEFLGREGDMPYNSEHVYKGEFSRAGPLRMGALDAINGSGGDNYGYWKVQIFEKIPDLWGTDAQFTGIGTSPSGLTTAGAAGQGHFVFKGNPEKADDFAITGIPSFTGLAVLNEPDGFGGTDQKQLTLAAAKGDPASITIHPQFGYTIKLYVKVKTSEIASCPAGSKGKLRLTDITQTGGGSGDLLALNLCGDKWSNREGYDAQDDVRITKPVPEPSA
jgi:hypothetical protein